MVFFRSGLLSAFFLFVGVMVGFAQAKPPKVREIILERTMCFGTCPAYKVTLRPDGTVLYEGVAHVARIGKYRASIWTGDYEKLAQLVDRLGLLKMKDSYTVHATDLPSSITTVKLAGKSKTINDYGLKGPIDLWAFNASVDGLLQNIRDWKKLK